MTAAGASLATMTISPFEPRTTSRSTSKSSGSIDRARQLNEDTLARRRRTLGEEHPETIRSANNLAVNLTSLDELERACTLLEDALSRRRQILGEDHPDTLSTAHNLAKVLARTGDIDQARRLDEDTLARRRHTLGDDHQDTLTTAHQLAGLLAKLTEPTRPATSTGTLSPDVDHPGRQDRDTLATAGTLRALGASSMPDAEARNR